MKGRKLKIQTNRKTQDLKIIGRITSLLSLYVYDYRTTFQAIVEVNRNTKTASFTQRTRSLAEVGICSINRRKQHRLTESMVLERERERERENGFTEREQRRRWDV